MIKGLSVIIVVARDMVGEVWVTIDACGGILPQLNCHHADLVNKTNPQGNIEINAQNHVQNFPPTLFMPSKFINVLKREVDIWGIGDWRSRGI
jgi:hypothetical protein